MSVDCAEPFLAFRDLAMLRTYTQGTHRLRGTTLKHNVEFHREIMTHNFFSLGLVWTTNHALSGLTILAYRYEGLRLSDFKANLRALKEEMEEDQSGPYHLRPACQTLVRWVTLAGGTMRGVKHGRGGSGEDRVRML